MADKNYPRIPAKNWWILRNRFKQSMPSSVSANYLATLLGITERGAQNVLSPFKTIGIIDEEGNTTKRANRWRVDQEYPQVCDQIRKEVYPEELLHAVPDPESNPEAAVRWFMRETGVGQGTARQMASFYQLLTKADPSEGQDITVGTVSPSRRRRRPARAERTEGAKKVAELSQARAARAPQLDQTVLGPTPSIHLNIQIHISPDASTDQIDQIFASMAKHFHTLRNSDEQLG